MGLREWASREEGGEVVVRLVEGGVYLEEVGWVGGGGKLLGHESGLLQRDYEVC